jgi:hypothetical protein
MPLPTREELVAASALDGIDEEEVARRIKLGGPTLRFVMREDYAKYAIKSGIDAMVACGVEGLVNPYVAPREVHCVTLMQQTPDGRTFHAFSCDAVRDEVVRRLSTDHVMPSLLRFANTIDVHGSFRGQVFEARSKG